ncbi:MAG: tripartite tricarboxylate transporter TctB family protein [Nitrincola lacisaponensis]|uniref:tripartite tricarboxylate transporter TctB family protein n=1 Tax=Nitrincola lacisaponensis TaxID=267850 RepID=UPI00391DC1B1
MNKLKKDYGHLCMLLGLAGFTIWYLSDAIRVSFTTPNLLLILPVSLAVLLLCIAELIISTYRGKLFEAVDDEPVRDILPIILLFAVYVLTLPWLGFDLGTILFVAIFLRMKNERNWFWVLGYSIGFGIAIALFFALMLPYPMPMTFLPID